MAQHESHPGHVDCLDGLRGVAALWVVIGHSMKLSGWGFKPFDAPDLAVDLFILLSGFLMAFHYIRRRDREPWDAKSTWVYFWLRRFFRIAPLYYLALVAVLAAGPHLGAAREYIGQAIAGSGTSPARYYDQSLTNLFMHLSFLFGFSPTYGYRTAIPDWSIGLEMQFYLAFPFLMLAWERIGAIRTSVAVALCCLALTVLLPGFIGAFPMPTFLPTKLPLFLAGMLAAASLFAEARRWRVLLIAAAVVGMMPSWRTDGLFDVLARLCFIAALVMLPQGHRFGRVAFLQPLVALANGILRLKLLRFAGDVSYGVYLIHLMIMIPVVAAVIALLGPQASGMSICLISLAVTVAIAYPLAWLCHRAIEQPGVRAGRMAVEWTMRIRAGLARQPG